MKIAGIILILAADIFFLMYDTQRKNEKLVHEHELILFMQLMNMNVIERKMTLCDSIHSIKERISPYIDSFTEICEKRRNDPSVRKAFLEELKKYFSQADEKILNAVIDYFKILGETDKKTAVDSYKVILEECEGIHKNNKEELAKNIRLTRVVTFCVSCVAITVLI